MRNVTGTITLPDGSAYADSVLLFTLKDRYGVAYDTFEKDTLVYFKKEVTTDVNGSFSISLYETLDSDVYCYYELTLLSNPEIAPAQLEISSGAFDVDITEFISIIDTGSIRSVSGNIKTLTGVDYALRDIVFTLKNRYGVELDTFDIDMEIPSTFTLTTDNIGNFSSDFYITEISQISCYYEMGFDAASELPNVEFEVLNGAGNVDLYTLLNGIQVIDIDICSFISILEDYWASISTVLVTQYASFIKTFEDYQDGFNTDLFMASVDQRIQDMLGSSYTCSELEMM